MTSTIARRRVVFLTGTRADFGKLKPLMQTLQDDQTFDVQVFVTGMHMLAKYGYTCEEVERAGFRNIHKYINQNVQDGMDHVLAKTISGLADYVREIAPDLIVVHGDRVETLAGATVGALNNVLTAHVEGGEVSGTIDELIRHAVSKLSHIHFVANQEAQQRLLQLGEAASSIHVVGSPDVDVMNSTRLPTLEEVKRHYGFDFQNYGVLAFHPVTSELDDLERQVNVLLDQLIACGRCFVVVYPNNDSGTDIILRAYQRLATRPEFKVYPSMRFEYFLSLLRHADFMVGNSSAGVREAPHFGVPALNIGSRQHRRVRVDTVLDVPVDADQIAEALERVSTMSRRPSTLFGDGGSAVRFHAVLSGAGFWRTNTQKHFVDRPLKKPISVSQNA